MQHTMDEQLLNKSPLLNISHFSGWLLVLGIPAFIIYWVFHFSYQNLLPEAQLVIDEVEFLALAEADLILPEAEGEAVVLPHDWADFADSSTIDTKQAWYTATIELNVPPNRLWGLYLPNVTMNAAVYLNGELLGQGGRLQDPVARLWSQPQYFTIPNGMLRPGTNTIQVYLKTDPASVGYLGRIHLGPASELRPAFEQHYYLRSTLVKLITGMLFFSSLTIGLLWLLRRQDTLYGWYALTSLFWGIYNCNLFIVDIPLPTRWWDWLVNHVAMAGFVTCLIVFVHRYLELSRPRLERALFIYAIAGSLVLMASPTSLLYALALNVWYSSFLLIGIYPTYLVLWAYWARRGMIDLLLATTGMTIVLLALRDWMALFGFGELRGEGLFIQYAAPAAIAVFGWILIRDFVHSRNEAESLNRELEQRVEERTIELEKNYQRLRELERQQVLAGERDRIMRDMHDGMGGHLVSTLSMLETGQASQVQVADALRTALDDLRLMIDSLDPIENDLAMLLGMYRGRLEPRLAGSALQLNWQVEDVPPLPDFGPQKVLQVLRILQESVTNTLKYARASTLTIRTGCTGERVFISVADNGQGFAAEPGRQGGGRGLENMRRRARTLGGELVLDSSAQGVRVELWLPLQRG